MFPFVVFMLLYFCAGTAKAVIIELVPVGNFGNSDGLIFGGGSRGLGVVEYEYHIGKYEVTNDQYTEFLNAIALNTTSTTAAPYGLYHTIMDTDVRGGITEDCKSGSVCRYSVKANMGNKPVNWTSFYDAIRFINWLHNGQGTGDTEDGAYTLLGGTLVPTNGQDIRRNATATYVLPSEDEWIKAAHHKNDGATGNHFSYATSSNSAPTVAMANITGDIRNPGPNVANYKNGAEWNGQLGNVTTVGSAASPSPYGTFDQAGNVLEWTEALHGDWRALRGGSWRLDSFGEFFVDSIPENEGTGFVGFRVAFVPEPNSLLMGGMAWLGFLCLNRRHGKRSMKRSAVSGRGNHLSQQDNLTVV
jgi:formylglycine-generating enzyme required for sulfatase activity